MTENTVPIWGFLTNYATVLICIADDPAIRLRDLGDRIGITERAAHRLVTELATAGYITRQRNGRRNHYAINEHLPLPDAIAREQNVGQLLDVLTEARTPNGRTDRTQTTG